MKILKEQDIVGCDWDYLIVLDSCRFDIFKEVYMDYINEYDCILEKVKSAGSCTGEWLVKNFDDFYEYEYISANPYINSIGYGLEENREWDYNWVANKHFSRIIDVWEFGYDEDIGVVHPREVNKAFFNQKANQSKTILHYIQPHTPYLGFNRYSDSGNLKNIEPRTSFESVNEEKILKNIRDRLGYFYDNTRFFWFLRYILEGQMKGSTGEYLYRLSKEGKLIELYKEEIELALWAISNILNELKGKIIITSDHGEAFGEKGIWGHPKEKHISPLIEVPWIEIEK